MTEQTRNPPIMKPRRPDRFDDSLIIDRKHFSWPECRTLAVWLVPNVEAWTYDSAAGMAILPNLHNSVPDIVNYAWREYGIRVGLWRIADVFDSLGIRGTVALNSSVCELFPRVVEELTKRNWEIMGHGITNSQLMSSLTSVGDERDVIQHALGTIERTTGRRPRGWLGPALAESYDTLDLLAEQGVQYVADWNSDDQPYRMKVERGKMLSIPYCMELSDTRMFARHGYTGAEYFDAIVDQFETLYSESERIPRVMGIPLHPFLVGQPLRIKYLQKAITHMRARDRVWFATGAEIAEAYDRLCD